jgi:hypothetical protein
MEPVAIEESAAEECTCEPFTIVRYRDALQEPSFIDGVKGVEAIDGVLFLTDEDNKFLFAAPLEAILSTEKVG